MRSTYERINAGDIGGFGDLLAEAFVEHQGAPELPPTKSGTLDFFRMLLTAFPDMNMVVDDLIAEGDKTVARVTAKATHQGDFMGVPPTGNRVEMELIDIMRFDTAGRVCEHWGVADMLRLMQQLGVVPARPSA
jgi:predicted ester cyclase